jgi:hypothetical protein
MLLLGGGGAERPSVVGLRHFYTCSVRRRCSLNRRNYSVRTSDLLCFSDVSRIIKTAYAFFDCFSYIDQIQTESWIDSVHLLRVAYVRHLLSQYVLAI